MIGEVKMDLTSSYSLRIYFCNLGQPNPKGLGPFVYRRERELQTISGHEREHVTCCVTDLLRTRVAEWERPRGEHVLTPIVDSTRGEDFGGDIVLQSGDQLHVEPERKDFLGG